MVKKLLPTENYWINLFMNSLISVTASKKWSVAYDLLVVWAADRQQLTETEKTYLMSGPLAKNCFSIVCRLFRNHAIAAKFNN